jgi:UDP-GlcNAc:undecaprenyl-phosphate GlcNAc-1-phosphate transferase
VLSIVKGVTLGSILSSVAVLFLWRFQGYSRAVFMIDWLLLVVAVSASRVAERLVNEWVVSMAEGSTPVLIIGAGDTGELLLRQVKQPGQPRRRVVGFLDDDPHKLGSRIHGRAVLGSRQVLPSVLQAYGIREVYVAMGKPPGELLRHVREACEDRGVRWRVITTVASSQES